MPSPFLSAYILEVSCASNPFPLSFTLSSMQNDTVDATAESSVESKIDANVEGLK